VWVRLGLRRETIELAESIDVGIEVQIEPCEPIKRTIRLLMMAEERWTRSRAKESFALRLQGPCGTWHQPRDIEPTIKFHDASRGFVPNEVLVDND
jgi:hypothetical protein